MQLAPLFHPHESSQQIVKMESVHSLVPVLSKGLAAPPAAVAALQTVEPVRSLLSPLKDVPLPFKGAVLPLQCAVLSFSAPSKLDGSV
jgi:hypothetical protein